MENYNDYCPCAICQGSVPVSDEPVKESQNAINIAGLFQGMWLYDFQYHIHSPEFLRET